VHDVSGWVKVQTLEHLHFRYLHMRTEPARSYVFYITNHGRAPAIPSSGPAVRLAAG
jgi:hypothetical protein